MAVLTTNAAIVRNDTYVPPNAIIFAPPPHQSFQQQPSYPTQGGGCCCGRSHGGRNRRKRGDKGHGTPMPPLVPCVGGTGIIPYIPAGVQPPVQQPAPHFSNIVKVFINQNVRFLCGFDVEDWHTSATCNSRKAGHQDGFTHSNYMEYACTHHPFCKKAMHKTRYPSSF
jgi:hypothetical protein